MIILLWNLFHRYVIGTKWIKPKCRDEYCKLPPLAICLTGRCRDHCGSYRGCECEKKLSADELDMVKRFREGRLLEGR